MSIFAPFENLLLGLGILIALALFLLLWRVAELHRAVQTILDKIGPPGEDGGARDESPGKAESDAGGAPTRDQEFRQEEARRHGHQPPDDGRAGGAPASAAVVRAVAAYNALAANFSQAELQAFEERWHPRTVAYGAGNRLSDDPEGDLWLVRVEEGGDSCGLVVPGPDVMRKWEIYYRSMDSLAAKNLLEGLYDVGNGAPLRLKSAAVARETGGGWTLDTPGRFADS